MTASVSRSGSRFLAPRKTRRLVAACIVAAAVAFAPTTASASWETIQRSVGNIVQSPLDLVCSPFVAWMTLNRNIRDVDDTTAVRVAYYVPGYIWLVGVNAGASVIRGLTGALEFLPGLVLIPFDADLDPLFDPAERGEGLIEFENDVFPIKFGINYQAPAF